MPVKSKTNQTIIRYWYKQEEVIAMLVDLLGLKQQPAGPNDSFDVRVQPGLGIELVWTYTEGGPEGWVVSMNGMPPNPPEAPGPLAVPPPADAADPVMKYANREKKPAFRINPKDGDV